MARAPFPEARGRAASWPAPFCVSACFRGVPTPRLRPVLSPADDAIGERERELASSLSLLRCQPAGRTSFSFSLPAYSVFARMRAFVPARESFVNFIVSCTRDRAAPRPRLHFLRCHGSLFLGAVRAAEKVGAVPRVKRRRR